MTVTVIICVCGWISKNIKTGIRIDRDKLAEAREELRNHIERVHPSSEVQRRDIEGNAKIRILSGERAREIRAVKKR